MTPKEIRGYEETLAKILKEPDANERLNNLTELAKEVGASSTRMWFRTTPEGRLRGPPSNMITETEIVHNIKVALQTATMINMSKSSASMCKIASRNYKIALVAAGAALLSALAAWIAVLIR